ncbi:MAG: acyl-CoA reductase, partial [Myxococcota bacterium]
MSAYRQAPAHPLEGTSDGLRAQGPALRAVSEGEAAELLAHAAAQLRADDALVRALVASTGLSAAGVRWALRTTTDTCRVETLLSLRRRTGIVFEGRTNRTNLAAVILAGNVFTAAVRAMLLPLLLQVPVIVRASRRERVLPAALAASLPPPFRQACAVVEFDPTDEPASRALLSRADVVHVYGSDATVARWRALAPASAAFVPHGHGLGAAVLPAFVTQLERAAAALSVDVAAYDQRGCLSPLRVLVEGDARRADSFAEALAGALRDREEVLPRGEASGDARAAEARWRSLAAALAPRVWEAPRWAGARAGADPLPPPPGQRLVVVEA